MSIQCAHRLHSVFTADNQIVIDDGRRGRADAGDKTALAKSFSGLTRFRVEREHLTAGDPEKNARRGVRVAGPIGKASWTRAFRLEFPDLQAGDGIERVHVLARVEIEDAVNHQRGAFGVHVIFGVAGMKGPRAAQLGDIFRVDLL